jgi:hypothetical protein
MSAAADPFASIGAKPVAAPAQAAPTPAPASQNVDPFAAIGAKPVTASATPAAAPPAAEPTAKMPRTSLTEELAQGAGAATGEVVSTAAKGINKVMPDSMQIPKEGIAALDANNEKNSRTSGQKLGGFIEDVAQFMAGDELLKGLSYADKLAKIAPVVKQLEQYPRLMKVLETGMRQGAVSGAQTAAHGGSAGESAGAAVVGGGLGAGLEGLGLGLRKFWKPNAVSASDAAQKITDAVNPEPDQIPKLAANVSKHVSAIENFATENKIPLDSVENFSKAARGAAKSRTEFYYQQLLNPIKNELVGTSEIPNFGGEKMGEGATMSDIGKLDARLVKVNKMLESSYEGSGMTTEMKQGLEAEARGIRKVLFETMGKKLNLEPQVIAEVRGSMGELNHIAEHAEHSVNVSRNTANKEAQKPIKGSISPMGKEDFWADVAINKGINAVRGNPADNLVKEAFQHLQAEPAELPKPSVQQPGTRPAKPPAWRGAAAAGGDTDHLQNALQEIGGGKKFGELSTADQSRVATRAQEMKDAASPNGKSSIAEQIKARETERAAQDAAKAKQTAKRADLDKQRAAERDKAASNRATHGKYKAAEKGLGAGSGE